MGVHGPAYSERKVVGRDFRPVSGVARRRRRDRTIGDTALQARVDLLERERDRRSADGLDEGGHGRGIGADLEPLEILQPGDRRLAVEDLWAVGPQRHHLGIELRLHPRAENVPIGVDRLFQLVQGWRHADEIEAFQKRVVPRRLSHRGLHDVERTLAAEAQGVLHGHAEDVERVVVDLERVARLLCEGRVEAPFEGDVVLVGRDEAGCAETDLVRTGSHGRCPQRAAHDERGGQEPPACRAEIMNSHIRSPNGLIAIVVAGESFLVVADVR